MATSPVVCPRCTAPFQCGIDSGSCWCNGVKLSNATRAAFEQYYEGCLCQDCLKALEEGKPQAPTVRAFLAGQLRRRHGRKA